MKDFVLMLAPMEDHTSPEFRELCYKNGANSTFTEMARIASLCRNNKSSLSKTKITNGVPTYIQLIGVKEDELEKYLQTFEPEEGFLGFNLNLGCPAPKMIEKGYGAALIKRITKVKKLVQTIKDHNYPVSIKLRVGLNEFEKRNKSYLNLIKEVDVDFFVVHARHGKQTYEEPADFSVYEECVATGKVIIANGDINNKEQIKMLKKMGVKGAMIGRAAVTNPKIFNILKSTDI